MGRSPQILEGKHFTVTLQPTIVPFPLTMGCMQVIPTHLKSNPHALLYSSSTPAVVLDPYSLNPKINGSASQVPPVSFLGLAIKSHVVSSYPHFFFADYNHGGNPSPLPLTPPLQLSTNPNPSCISVPLYSFPPTLVIECKTSQPQNKLLAPLAVMGFNHLGESIDTKPGHGK